MQLIREKYNAPEVLPLDIRLEGAILTLSGTGATENIEPQVDWGIIGGWS